MNKLVASLMLVLGITVASGAQAAGTEAERAGRCAITHAWWASMATKGQLPGGTGARPATPGDIQFSQAMKRQLDQQYGGQPGYVEAGQRAVDNINSEANPTQGLIRLIAINGNNCREVGIKPIQQW